MLYTSIIETRIICEQPGRYIGWPTIARDGGQELFVVFSGSRLGHICPCGKVQFIKSNDNGKTWSEPLTIADSPIDDRDAGIIVLASGTLLVSWFTSLAYESVDINLLSETDRKQWQAAVAGITENDKRDFLGNWVIMSDDRGETWSDPISTLLSAPHGPIKLESGTLAYAGIGHVNSSIGNPEAIQTASEKFIGLEISTNEGLSWEFAGTVPIPENEDIAHYHEPHLIQTAFGLTMLLRYEPQDSSHSFLRQSLSLDGGKAWTPAVNTSIWGYPPHLTRLMDGRILLSYSRRKPPFGQYACISRDEGESWDLEHELRISAAESGDMGYPATVQLEDGTLYTVYYDIPGSGRKTVLKAAHWDLLLDRPGGIL